MAISENLEQRPAPGKKIVAFKGDTVRLSLKLREPMAGSAWVRTNLGHGDISRREIIREVHLAENPLGRDWFDTPMKRVDAQRFQIRLALSEVGHYEAKCFFLAAGQDTPIWPAGKNVILNVEPAGACCANIIYNGFVRQFGPNKCGRKAVGASESEWLACLDRAGYTVIPPSGTFRDLVAELDFIFDHLGCRILMLLPIHPTPTTYGRMGRFGSPYAALSFTDVDPALAVFDPSATPLEQFEELVDAVHRHRAKIFIDIATNHTGWAASLHEAHPEWLVRSSEGRIEVPGAWGVRWEDLTKLDYNRTDLWRFMAGVFLKWCRRGVDGFRCDAGYMIPHAAWRYIVARVREQFPDTVFLLEGLGGKISVTRRLLNTANLNWSYSELFQNYDRGQIEHYLPEAIQISRGDGITVHFAETHDNPRLAARSHAYARMRTALCALCSCQGAFGFANGVEWFATEKIDVHDASPLNWGAAENQVDDIRRLNRILKQHPVFRQHTDLRLIQQSEGNHVVLLRHHRPTGKKMLVIVNLDAENPVQAAWNPAECGLAQQTFVDLLTERGVRVSPERHLFHCRLTPGEVMCLSPDPEDLELIRKNDGDVGPPRHVVHQRLRSKVLEILNAFQGIRDLSDFDLDRAAGDLAGNPVALCAALNEQSAETRVVTWQWPRDLRREVMVPPDHCLLVRAPVGFRARLIHNRRTLGLEESFLRDENDHFTLFVPTVSRKESRSCRLKLKLFEADGCRHADAPVILLPRAGATRVQRKFRPTELSGANRTFLATNRRGGMLRAPLEWGRLASRYDALLAANCDPETPVDRWILLSRCRAWAVYQGYSQDINLHSLKAFVHTDQPLGIWRFHVPTGQGQYVLLAIVLEMVPDKNTMRMHIVREASGNRSDRLADDKRVQIILRPDIESRSFHDVTKAYMGPQEQWPQAFETLPNGFIFTPIPGRRLQMNISEGEFVTEPEWYYMVHRPLEAERGLDPDSDLFSPGYFISNLAGRSSATLIASAEEDGDDSTTFPAGAPDADTWLETRQRVTGRPPEVLASSLQHYVVRRAPHRSIIAGYPWFLDWGRDALIFARGLVAAGRTHEAREVLIAFGRFEAAGTLPNMIVGSDAGNRDTSDAPLWFSIACRDLLRAEGGQQFLEVDCGGRPVRQVLKSIAQSYISGTPNGVRMDPESGLIFSPAHFTWMDTDHPAGTPRQGYPVEIQALWVAALRFLAAVEPAEKTSWGELADRVQCGIRNYFWLAVAGFLSDCLHADPGQPARASIADDALRPNQLFAITLGAVEDRAEMRSILSACEELLVPGAIRSLADRPVRFPIEIKHHGRIINDPLHPYQGVYSGDEDTRRKPAYHNGTAWTWPFPTFCEAWAKAYGTTGKKTALALLASGSVLLNQGCVGHIPEILDGNYPHTPRGCDAQAWGASELLRVWLELTAEG
jgi:predicted glycogen debranching enzyme